MTTNVTAKRWSTSGSRQWILVDPNGRQVGATKSLTRDDKLVYYTAYYFRTKREALEACRPTTSGHAPTCPDTRSGPCNHCGRIAVDVR